MAGNNTLISSASANMGSKMTLKPVTVGGIQFDMLNNEQLSYTSEVPSYPVETGYSVSDNISFNPFTLELSLIISETPVTFRGYKNYAGRSIDIHAMLEEMYWQKQEVKVVTNLAIYTDMVITSINSVRSPDIGKAIQVNISLQKIIKTSRATATIPASIGKSGTSANSAGTATTSKSPTTATAKNETNKDTKNAASSLLSKILGVKSKPKQQTDGGR